MIQLSTSKGPIKLRLFYDKAPITAKNFEEYVRDGFYDGTLFHRVIPGFMVQAGGFDKTFSQKETGATIKNEADNGLSNKRGTLAMARTPDPHSASAQFFINVADNTFLNHTAPTPQGWGYCVFGEVVEGMDIVEAIEGVKTGRRGMHADVPVDDVVIEHAEVIEDQA
ncbi:Peptidyl-prolyl cis-trans isomerase B [Halomonadaceae bacterium LMG 33818]|uniref:peptidylprolyl isomerase n=1 Tax=Cernens ardua TaxID=3402176 RepID=UPI003EDCA387